MQVFTSLSHTSLDRILVCLAHRFTILNLAQRSNRIGKDRLGQHLFDAFNLLVVGGLFRLGTQAFCHTQEEAGHTLFVRRLDSCFPLRRANHLTHDLAGLWVHAVGFDTNTLLLPHIKFQEERRIESLLRCSQFTYVLHEQAQLTLQSFVFGFQSTTIDNVGYRIINVLDSSQGSKLLLIEHSRHGHHVLVDLAGVGLVLFDHLAQICWHVHDRARSFLLSSLDGFQGWETYRAFHLEQLVHDALGSLVGLHNAQGTSRQRPISFPSQCDEGVVRKGITFLALLHDLVSCAFRQSIKLQRQHLFVREHGA